MSNSATTVSGLSPDGENLLRIGSYPGQVGPPIEERDYLSVQVGRQSLI